MRVLYAVASEGLGHATRAKAVIEHLKDQGHTVKVTAGGRALDYLQEYDPVPLEGLHLWYRDNVVRPYYSVWGNLRRLPRLLRTFWQTKRVIETFRPDVVVSDFTFVAPYWARWKGIPFVTLDNNRLLAKSWPSYPYRYFRSYVQSLLPTWCLQPRAQAHIIPFFWDHPIAPDDTYLTRPPLRQALQQYTPSKAGHILVYQTHKSHDRLWADLKHWGRSCIVYGTGRTGCDGPLTFKSFSERDFFEDLASADAVIMNGSFSLMAEALYLKKPVLAIPVRQHFEQEFNALELERCGYGMMAEHSSVERFEEFSKRWARLEENLQSYEADPASTLRVLDHVMTML